MMTPLQRYQSDVNDKIIRQDNLQWEAVKSTQRLYAELNIAANKKRSFFSSFFKHKSKPVKGIYLYGGTGRGKTYLVDSFYQCLPGERKHRIHFHRFMLDIHQQLEELPKSQDPLNIIAEQLASKFDVLCLDEFHVHDIADAMILAGLLKPLFDNGVTLVATSNISVDNLYRNGLQRDRFMTAIELLLEHTEQVDLGDTIDYRFSILDESDFYYIITDETRDRGEDYLYFKFVELAPCKPKSNRSVTINNRKINYILFADDIIWFDFKELCYSNRSAKDYIEMAGCYQTILVSNLEVMHEKDDAAAKRFIHFIDAVYDHNVKLMMTALDKPEAIYQGTKLQFAFARTISRLVEMRSESYLRLAHNPTGTVRTVREDS